MNILITGMSGLIGAAAGARLASNHSLTALNRSAVDGVRTVQADIGDAEAIAVAFENQDVAVHLAAKAGEDYTWDELLTTNVAGTRNVFEAARQAGVRRVVFASSGATVAGCEFDEPYASLVSDNAPEARPDTWPMIDVHMPTRPRGVYGATKVWGEAIARHYSDRYGMSVICLRIGFVNAEDRPTNARQFSVWCSQRDIVDAIERSVEAADPRPFAAVFVNSNNRSGYRDLTETERVLGWRAQDSADTFR